MTLPIRNMSHLSIIGIICSVLTSFSSSSSSSSSIGTTARYGFRPRWTISFHFFLSATNSLHLLTPSTWRSLSTSFFHPFLGLPLRLVSSSSWVKIFLGIPSSSILSTWPNQINLCPFIHFTIFSPYLISSSSRFVLLLHSLFSYLGPYILLNIFLSKINRACSSFFVKSMFPFLTTLPVLLVPYIISF